MVRDYEAEDFDLNGDLLDNIMIEEFGLAPKYVMYWVLRDLVFIGIRGDIITAYEDTIKLYCEEKDKLNDYDVLLQGINRLFTSSNKRLVKKGSSQNTFHMLCERYKAMKNKKGRKQNGKTNKTK